MSHKHCVLIVDDDDDVRETLAFVLADEGVDVRTATNGQEALDLLRRDFDLASDAPHALPCAILLDLMMPVMDGRAFREEQLRTPPLAAIPVVLLTAAAGFGVPAIDVDHVLTKPVTIDALLAIVARLCPSP